ncbi:MAG: hypothetical protein ACLT9Y_05195 [Peptostreptococcus anaerobius]|uniref:hypothetical protein n=1 Tax=Peptostreptococcus anaerobius TaxID=1261 RepID=UPI003A2D3EAA
MLKGLYRCYLSPDSQIAKLFKVNASESARGVRFILNDFRELEKLSFRHVIKINDQLFENEQIIFDKEDGYFDVIFPPLEPGKYKSEIAIICEGKKLLSGIFELEYLESLIGGEAAELKKLNGADIFERLMSAENEINELVEKTKSLTEIVDKNYTHDQIQASTSWMVQHNLNKYPSVSVVDSGKNEVVGDINYIDKNNLVINFSHAFSGKAFLN